MSTPPDDLAPATREGLNPSRPFIMRPVATSLLMLAILLAIFALMGAKPA